MDCHHSGGCRNKFGRTYYLRGYNLLETPDDSKVQDSLCKKGMRVFYGILFAENGDQESKIMSQLLQDVLSLFSGLVSS